MADSYPSPVLGLNNKVLIFFMSSFLVAVKFVPQSVLLTKYFGAVSKVQFKSVLLKVTKL